MHQQSHAHSHSHNHSPDAVSVDSAFIIGIALNFLFVIAEVIAGLMIHSLSLLSDAGHNLMDVAGLSLSLLAFRLMKVKPTTQYTYGYKKTSIIVALFNSVVLLVSVGAISIEAVQRFFHPEPLQGKTIAIIAGIGIIINFSSALLFFWNKEKDLNIKSAYLHLFSDALVSLGIVAGGILIIFSGWYWIDAAVSMIIAAVILLSTWNLLRESLRLSLDGVPGNVDAEKIKTAAINIDGVKELHHVHIWAMSTSENALTAHLVLKNNVAPDQEQKIKQQLRHELMHLNIQHSTFETEREQELCDTIQC